MKFASSGPKNVFADKLSKVSNEVGQPVHEQDRFSYGKIIAVNDKNQVRVKLYDLHDEYGDELIVLSGTFIPVIPELSEIELKYGSLRPGLQVMVHWRGKLEPTWAIAHVIGDEDLNILEKAPSENRIDGPPVEFMMGGLLG